MKKFGMKKDQGGENDDSNRSALFGRRNPKVGTSDPSKNPYAAASSPDPYARESRGGGGGGNYGAPPSYDGRGDMDQRRAEKTPVPAGGYGGGRDEPRRGYGGAGAYGGQGGYGDDRYDSQPSARRGGYGGMGGSRDTMNTDAGRNELFGGAAQRYEQRQQQPGGYGRDQESGIGGGDEGYGTYQDRELTAEEAEEEDIKATKDQIRFIKRQDVDSTRNMLRIAQQAEETGRDTLARLGAQGERIHNTEKNLDLAANQNRIAEEKAKELKTLNRSMFAVHVSNPFTATKRREEREQKILDTHQRERDQRDATRAQAYSSQSRRDDFSRGMQAQEERPQFTKASAAERAKYQFEADSEDEEMENEIDQNLQVAHGAVGRLKHLATAMGSEVDAQNEHIRRIIGKTDKVDDQIAMNRARLDKFK